MPLILIQQIKYTAHEAANRLKEKLNVELHTVDGAFVSRAAHNGTRYNSYSCIIKMKYFIIAINKIDIVCLFKKKIDVYLYFLLACQYFLTLKFTNKVNLN